MEIFPPPKKKQKKQLCSCRDYFKPLEVWLIRENKKNKAKVLREHAKKSSSLNGRAIKRGRVGGGGGG